MRTLSEIKIRIETLKGFQKFLSDSSLEKNQKSFGRVYKEMFEEEFPYAKKNVTDVSKIVEGEIFALNWTLGMIERKNGN